MHAHDDLRRHHDHAGPGDAAERTTLRAFLLTAGFMLVEAGGGWLSGSLALLADAAHMLTDAAALALAWLAFRLGRLDADHKRTYGYRRLEVLAALINGVAVMGLAGWIVWEATGRLSAPAPVLGLPMLVVAAVGLAVNLFVLRTLHRGHDHDTDINLRGAALHVLGDLIGSAAAVAAALVILWTGWTPIDPLLSMGVAALIVVNAWRLIGSAIHILLEGVPADFDAGEVRAALERLPGVAGVHHIHAWSLTGGQPLVTLHVALGHGAEPAVTLAAVKNELERRFHLAHSVVQLEAGPCPDLDVRCN